MIQKLVSIPISDVIVPSTIITETAKKELDFIAKHCEEEKSELFFITVTLQASTKKYILVDRYDVYAATIQSKSKEVRALVMKSKKDPTQAHFQITMKSVLNPVKIINIIRPYIEEFGMEETVKKLHLHVDFVQMYKLELDQKTLDKLGKMITRLCDAGVRTSIPLSLFIFISKIQKKQRPVFLKSLETLVNKSDRHFRWPHNAYLRKLEMGNDGNDAVPKKAYEEKLPIPDLEFCCQQCDTQYVLSEGILSKRENIEGFVVQHKNDSMPRIQIPAEMTLHLGVTAKKPPKIISNNDISPEDILAHLAGKKFLIILGEKQGQ